jgi:hypothetical protein
MIKADFIRQLGEKAPHIRAALGLLSNWHAAGLDLLRGCANIIHNGVKFSIYGVPTVCGGYSPTYVAHQHGAPSVWSKPIYSKYHLSAQEIAEYIISVTSKPAPTPEGVVTIF